MTHSIVNQYAELTEEERKELGSRFILEKRNMPRGYYDICFTTGRRIVASVWWGQGWVDPDTTLVITPDWTKPTPERRYQWYQVRVYDPRALDVNGTLVELRNCGHRHQHWETAQRCLDQLRNRGMTLEERRMGWLWAEWRWMVVVVEVWP